MSNCSECGEDIEPSPYVPGEYMHSDDSHPHDHYATEAECLCALHGGVFCNGCPVHDWAPSPISG